MPEEKITIENCKLPFECPLEWGSLVKTELDNVMYCAKCDRGVHICRTDAELRIARSTNQCLAIVRLIKSRDGALVEDMYVGGEGESNYEAGRPLRWD